MKLFNSSLITALILVAFLTSCKKTQEDTPTPSSGQYRIKYNTFDNKNFKGKSIFTYNAQNQLIKVTSTEDATGEVIQLETYQYNANELKTTYTNTYGTEVTTNKYEYDGNNLLTTKYEYTGTDLNNPIEILYYYYDSNNNIIKRVRKTYGASGYKDSTLYSGFINGRPTLQTTYSGYETYNSGAYTLSRKERFTYDARMNLILREETKNNDLNVFYDASEYTYIPFTNEMKKVENLTKAAYDPTEYGLKSDTDFISTHNINWEQTCNATYEPGIHSSETKTVTLNSNKLISKLITSSDTYDGCGNVNNNFTNTSYYFYETF